MKGIKENFALSSIVTVFNKPFNFFDGYINKKTKTCGSSMKSKPYYIILLLLRYFVTYTIKLHQLFLLLKLYDLLYSNILF